MGRPGLMRHRKFARLSRLLGSDALARGHLEILWDVAYENGDPNIGDSGDLEHLAKWTGEEGRLASAMVEAGFVDSDPAGLLVHDLWDHAPDYVAGRRERENERRKPKTCAGCGKEFRSPDARAAHCSQACRQTAYRNRKTLGDAALRTHPSHVTECDTTPSPSPSPSPSPKEKQLPSTAAAPTVEGGLLPGVASASPVRQRVAKPAKPAKPVDPRQRPLQLALEAAFRSARNGADYGFHSRDARALVAILALSRGDQAEAVRRFTLGLNSDFKARCDAIWELEQKWNTLAAPRNGTTSTIQPARPVLS